MKLQLVHKFRFTLALAAALSLASVAPLKAQQTQELTIPQARALADQALQAGEFGLARAVSEGLLQANPDDYSALVIAASAEIALGNYGKAAKYASTAYRVAPDKPRKLHAARIAASAKFRDKQYFGAEFWLRAARQNAQSPGESRAVSEEFAAVKRANPVKVSLNFSVAPNSNINNGSESEFITIWGLPFVLSPDARALSGWEYSLGFDASLKLSEGPRHRTEIGIVGSSRTYELSSASRAAAPNVSGSDYAFSALETYIRHNWLHRAANGPAQLGLTVGRNWYGGDPFTNYSRATLGQEWRFENGFGLNLGLNVQRQMTDATGATSFVRGLSANMAAPATQAGRFTFGLTLENTTSDNPTEENRASRVNMGYSFAQPILGTNVSLRLGLERRDYPVSPYDPDGRQDETVTAGVNIGIPSWSYFGFSPVVSLESRRSFSNVALYQRESYGMRVGIQSRF